MISEDLRSRGPFFLGVSRLALELDLDLEDVVEELIVMLDFLEREYNRRPPPRRHCGLT